MAMKYISLVLGPIETNCYIVYDDKTRDAMVVDPAWDYEQIHKKLETNNLTLKLIFLTHGHADHIGALQELRQRENVPVYVGAGDASLISNSKTICPCLWDGLLNVRHRTALFMTEMKFIWGA